MRGSAFSRIAAGRTLRAVSGAALTAALCGVAAGSRAQSPALPQIEPLRLAECASIGAPADRLACYDLLAGRAPPEPVTPADTAPTTLLAPGGMPVAVAQEPGGSGSLMSAYWELEDADKRGTFNFIGYRPNYVLPLHLTSRINRTPQSPTQQVVNLPDYRVVEAKFQLSLRTKVVQDLLLPGADLWLAFTQQALWQIWNTQDSKPFRNSDYEPEAIYIVPTSYALQELPFGWRWRYTQLGIAHQSNGQSDPLSRSWNRYYLGAGFERGNLAFTARVNKRINEPYSSDNNPDLLAFRGRGEFRLDWTSKLATMALTYRSSLRNVSFGALEFEWTYPIYRDQPNGLRWYVQLFRGYGETLTDYNFRQTSIGAGVTFLAF
ncbi:phospholipase A [Piscinibacter sakaiensis]|uniref:phospholipase A n=1 Tax=Piscinibacter sakaiensis TaxID=1547922 RepID=UPI003AAC7967